MYRRGPFVFLALLVGGRSYATTPVENFESWEVGTRFAAAPSPFATPLLALAREMAEADWAKKIADAMDHKSAG
jgi:hypothetical protein